MYALELIHSIFIFISDFIHVQEYQEKIEQKQATMKKVFEKQERQRRLNAEMEKLKREEREEEAKRLDKIKSYQRLKQLEEIERDMKERQKVKEEIAKAELLKKSLKANSIIFKGRFCKVKKC